MPNSNFDSGLWSAASYMWTLNCVSKLKLSMWEWRPPSSSGSFHPIHPVHWGKITIGLDSIRLPVNKECRSWTGNILPKARDEWKEKEDALRYLKKNSTSKHTEYTNSKLSDSDPDPDRDREIQTSLKRTTIKVNKDVQEIFYNQSHIIKTHKRVQVF